MTGGDGEFSRRVTEFGEADGWKYELLKECGGPGRHHVDLRKDRERKRSAAKCEKNGLCLHAVTVPAACNGSVTSP